MSSATAEMPRIGDWRSEEELLRLQSERLAHALETARCAPFYRWRIPKGTAVSSLSGLSKLPVTTKRDLREAYPFGLLAVPNERLAVYHESSGTSGLPTSSYFTEKDWSDVVERFSRSAVGFTATDTVLVRTPYSMVTTAHQAHQGARSKGATVIPADNRSLIMPYSRVVRLLRDLGVSVAWCLPSECLFWAAAARHVDHDTEKDFPGLRSFLVAGEPISDAKRARISEIWGGTRVIVDYGSTETGSLAGQCKEGNLHLWADRFFPEVYDPETGEAKREGLGQLVVTSLYREAMPLVRYNLEDLVELSYSACGCGWHLPIVKVHGRAAGRLIAGGIEISQVELEELVYRLPKPYEVMFWRARCRPFGLEIELEAPPETGPPACSELKEAIAVRLGIRAEVRSLPPGTLLPEAVLAKGVDFAKPRYLFREDEDWTKAVVYY